jgi:predicted alpha/beta hydrolase family esterase
MVAPISDFRVLIVPGLNDSGPDHWQSHWQAMYPAFERVEQRDWDTPELEPWSEQIGNALRRSARPAVIVAHSFGCLATAHRAALGAPNLHGALLVAPADPEKFGLADRLQQAEFLCPSTLIGSDNDRWMGQGQAAWWASQWGCEFISAGALGHINADSGIGDWLFGLAQLQRLVQRIPARKACRCGSEPDSVRPP